MTDDLARRTVANRRRVADLVERLDEAQLASPSLCAGWSCRDVVGHLVMAVDLSVPRFLLEVLRDRGRVARTSTRVAQQVGARPVPDLVHALREHAGDRLSPPGVGPTGPFVDSCIHLRDIALPLDLDDGPPLEDWARVLDLLRTPQARAAGFLPRGRLDGLRLRATDQGWSAGTGAEVAGTSEALALAATGRAVGLAELEGPGLPLLRQRVAPGG
ncbi:maleylpyruvate isomerase family mycothiol-dependent enzyme [Pseudokineococcus basanitobsidens]|uniref:Maleylpyruvate isomerase family mycothiol-dependent enzyme n=1 Tax=Pseudokineococcus basanitobsidens TaxID=1926649 RepID=A0ABU8RMC8_9ACTN